MVIAKVRKNVAWTHGATVFLNILIAPESERFTFLLFQKLPILAMTTQDRKFLAKVSEVLGYVPPVRTVCLCVSVFVG